MAMKAGKIDDRRFGGLDEKHEVVYSKDTWAVVGWGA